MWLFPSSQGHCPAVLSLFPRSPPVSQAPAPQAPSASPPRERQRAVLGGSGTPQALRARLRRQERPPPLAGGSMPLGCRPPSRPVRAELGTQMAERSSSWPETRPHTGSIRRGAPRGPLWTRTRSSWLALNTGAGRSASRTQVTREGGAATLCQTEGPPSPDTT